LAHSPRSWSGARTPSAIKRVRQAERRRAINQPRRSAAKTLVSRTLAAVNNNEDAAQIEQLVQRAVSALDRAAKIGAIHRNAASRRKSRLMLKVSAAVGGEALVTAGRQGRTTGKAAAAKQAKARIAASKATKAKGAQTAAGKARAALARTTRETTAAGATEQAVAAEAAPATPAVRRARSTKAAPATAKKAATTAAKKAATTRKPRAARSTTNKS
jgi:small subunit ribosomal protein S20